MLRLVSVDDQQKSNFVEVDQTPGSYFATQHLISPWPPLHRAFEQITQFLHV